MRTIKINKDITLVIKKRKAAKKKHKKTHNQTSQINKKTFMQIMTNFKTLMIEIMLKIKMLFEFLFKIEIKKVLIPALLFTFLSSCSPTQRVNRIVERYNLSIKDTTIIKADTLETVLSRSVFYQDTVFFYVTEKETQKIYVKGDTVAITTIVPEKKIVTEKINVQPAKKNKTAVWLATIFGISFFLLFGLLIYIVIQLKLTFK